jgi:HlyD family secretion protein
MTKEPRKWSTARPMWIGGITTLVLVAGFGWWSVGTHIAGAVVTSGQIEVEQHRQVVQHPDGGVVDEIFVVDGREVSAGDILIRLDGSVLRSELVIVEGQLFEVLAQRARLEAERDGLAAPVFPDELVEIAGSRPEVQNLMTGQQNLFEARRETLSRQIEQLNRRIAQTDAQVVGIGAQIAALGTQKDLIARELTDQRDLLAKGLAQASRVLALEREQASLEGQVGELTAGQAQAEGRKTEVELEILRLADARREESTAQLRDIGAQELELAERRRVLTERISRLDIAAPVSGIVLGMQVTTPRSVIRPADPLLYIIPQDRPLVIAAQVSPIHVDEVHVGQEVKLLFPAFSSRTTPELHGRVSMVSPDALTDQRTQQSFYRAEIELSPGEAEKLGGVTLLPGMPVEAFIQTEERTPMAYLVKPFTDYFVRAFREG